jgi:hypothetical protein
VLLSGIEVKTSYGGPHSRFDDGVYGLEGYDEVEEEDGCGVWGVRLAVGHADAPGVLLEGLSRFLDIVAGVPTT